MFMLPQKSIQSALPPRKTWRKKNLKLFASSALTSLIIVLPSQTLGMEDKDSNQGNVLKKALQLQSRELQATREQLEEERIQKERLKRRVEDLKKQASATGQNNVDAQLELGQRYYNGKGVDQSYNQAVEWFLKAAEQGNANAQYWLGICYFKGQGFSQDIEEALKWCTKSASQGNVEAKHFMDGYEREAKEKEKAKIESLDQQQEIEELRKQVEAFKMQLELKKAKREAKAEKERKAIEERRARYLQSWCSEDSKVAHWIKNLQQYRLTYEELFKILDAINVYYEQEIQGMSSVKEDGEMWAQLLIMSQEQKGILENLAASIIDDVKYSHLCGDLFSLNQQVRSNYIHRTNEATIKGLKEYIKKKMELYNQQTGQQHPDWDELRARESAEILESWCVKDSQILQSIKDLQKDDLIYEELFKILDAMKIYYAQEIQDMRNVCKDENMWAQLLSHAKLLNEIIHDFEGKLIYHSPGRNPRYIFQERFHQNITYAGGLGKELQYTTEALKEYIKGKMEFYNQQTGQLHPNWDEFNLL